MRDFEGEVVRPIDRSKDHRLKATEITNLSMDEISDVVATEKMVVHSNFMLENVDEVFSGQEENLEMPLVVRTEKVI